MTSLLLVKAMIAPGQARSYTPKGHAISARGATCFDRCGGANQVDQRERARCPERSHDFYIDVIGPATWVNTSNNEDGFRIYAQLPGGEPRISAEFSANAMSGAANYTLPENCSATFWVVAFNTAGESGQSNSMRLLPPPSGCPGVLNATYTNDTTHTADEMGFDSAVGVESVMLTTNAPGCGEPMVRHVLIDWPSPCVDPGESVSLEFQLISPSRVDNALWSVIGAPPNAPAKLRAASPVPRLEWNDMSTNEDGFRVVVQVPGQAPAVIATYPAGRTVREGFGTGDLSLDCQQPQVWILAFNSAGESSPSNSYQVPRPDQGCPATTATPTPSPAPSATASSASPTPLVTPATLPNVGGTIRSQRDWLLALIIGVDLRHRWLRHLRTVVAHD